jgi:hypothetical protein
MMHYNIQASHILCLKETHAKTSQDSINWVQYINIDFFFVMIIMAL